MKQRMEDGGWRNLFQRSRFELLRCFTSESSTFVAEKKLKAKLNDVSVAC